MKLALVVNPNASAVTPAKREAAQQMLSEGHDLAVMETQYREHATLLAREAAAGGADVVVVLGGDGTMNEAANGLVGTDTAMAALPGGSTNVFARTIGSARKVKPALRQLTEALDRPTRRMGLGLVNGRYFLFHVGIGFDAAVVAQVEEKPHLKRKIGQAVFVYAAFSTWFRRFDRSRPHFSVELEGRTAVEDGYFGICLNTNPYTYLGLRALSLAPDAGLDTPLTMLTLRTIKAGVLLSAVGSALGSGKRARRSRKVDYRPNLTALTINGHGSFPYQADGDYLGEAEQLTISYEPDRLSLVMPTSTKD